MTLLVLALVAFGIVHNASAIPRLRNWATRVFGRAHGAVHGLASLILLVATLLAFRFVDATPLYQTPWWGTPANFVLSLVAFVCVGIFLFRGSWRNRLKFPVAYAVTFWSSGHVLANGDMRSTVFFLGFLGIALVHVFLTTRLTKWQASDVRAGHNILSVLFGIALYGIMAQVHTVIAGVPVIDLAGFAR